MAWSFRCWLPTSPKLGVSNVGCQPVHRNRPICDIIMWRITLRYWSVEFGIGICCLQFRSLDVQRIVKQNCGPIPCGIRFTRTHPCPIRSLDHQYREVFGSTPSRPPPRRKKKKKKQKASNLLELLISSRAEGRLLAWRASRSEEMGVGTRAHPGEGGGMVGSGEAQRASRRRDSRRWRRPACDRAEDLLTVKSTLSPSQDSAASPSLRPRYWPTHVFFLNSGSEARAFFLNSVSEVRTFFFNSDREARDFFLNSGGWRCGGGSPRTSGAWVARASATASVVWCGEEEEDVNSPIH
ncbi:unnamed protein product [Urochloa humidicola]